MKAVIVGENASLSWSDTADPVPGPQELLIKVAATAINRADLMRISGVGPQFSELLEAAGVDTVKELCNRNAENLATVMSETNAEKKLAKSSPASKMVQEWIEQAKGMDPLITH